MNPWTLPFHEVAKGVALPGRLRCSAHVNDRHEGLRPSGLPCACSKSRTGCRSLGGIPRALSKSRTGHRLRDTPQRDEAARASPARLPVQRDAHDRTDAAAITDHLITILPDASVGKHAHDRVPLRTGRAQPPDTARTTGHIGTQLTGVFAGLADALGIRRKVRTRFLKAEQTEIIHDTRSLVRREGRVGGQGHGVGFADDKRARRVDELARVSGRGQQEGPAGD